MKRLGIALWVAVFAVSGVAAQAGAVLEGVAPGEGSWIPGDFDRDGDVDLDDFAILKSWFGIGWWEADLDDDGDVDIEDIVGFKQNFGYNFPTHPGKPLGGLNLHIDAVGNGRIVNDGDSPFTFDAFAVASDARLIDHADWTTIGEGLLAGTIRPEWLGMPLMEAWMWGVMHADAFLIAECHFSAEATLQPGASFPLGAPFSQGTPADLTFLYVRAGYLGSWEGLVIRDAKGGDADLDGDVDLDDFVIVKDNFGTGSSWSEGDFDGDGDVDLDDFSILKLNYQT
ncbi:MAG: hypothetical protein GX591_06245 [Planctomycetes bacterium]|nr:hypothetical protein [Planctomycetota bacterium]